VQGRHPPMVPQVHLRARRHELKQRSMSESHSRHDGSGRAWSAPGCLCGGVRCH
jgi:hypothetical protein